MAIQLLSVIQNVEFQISRHTFANIFAITIPPSHLLQSENNNLSTAMALVLKAKK